MSNISLKIDNTEFHAAASWNQLDQSQFTKVAHHVFSIQQLVLSAPENSIEITAHKLHIARIALNLPMKYWMILNEEHHATLLPVADPFLNELALSDTFIKSFEHNKTTYHGPGSRFKSCSIEEFVNADSYYMQFYKTKKVVFLYYLAASLYREYSSDNETNKGNARVNFNPNHVGPRAQKLERMNIHTLHSIFMQYQGVRTWLQKKYPLVFPKSDNQEKNSSNTNGLGSMILELSGGKFGTYEQTKSIDVVPFMEEMSNLIQQNKEHEKRLRKMKSHAKSK